MDDRLSFHNALQAIFPSLKLIFRPSTKDLLVYPCIVYDIKDYNHIPASNTAYVRGTTFKVTIMSLLPGYLYSGNILQMPGASHSSSYISDNIVHDVFNVTVKTS